jgi:hypothetical protein
VTTPVQHQQQQHCNAGNSDSTMLAMTPATCRQGRQRNTHRDTSAESAEGPVAMDDAKYGSKAMGNDKENGNDLTYTNVLQLHQDWADASLRCWRQCRCNETDNTSKTRAQ